MNDPMPTILSILNPPPILTGRPGNPGDRVPAGWAYISDMAPYTDDFTDWLGPILSETEDRIVIDVWGSPLAFVKDRWVQVRRHE